MTTTDVLASVAVVVSLASLLLSFLAYRRTRTIDVLMELRIQHFASHQQWWLVTVSVENRSDDSLIPTRLRLSRPRSARLSTYLAPVGQAHAQQLPEAAVTSPLVKSIGEQDIAKVIRYFAPSGEDEFTFLVFVPKTTSRLLSVEMSVRKQHSQRTETYSAQSYLPWHNGISIGGAAAT
jgi:hypothetical protein